MVDALALLKAQEPRVMTLDELKEYVSLPPVFVDDLSMQEDYLRDIAPLYTDFPDPEESWIVHWRDAFMLRQHVMNAERSYGKRWRCWTARPTDEQRKAVKWDD